MTVEKAGVTDINALVKLRLAYLREDFGSLDDSDDCTYHQMKWKNNNIIER